MSAHSMRSRSWLAPLIGTVVAGLVLFGAGYAAGYSAHSGIIARPAIALPYSAPAAPHAAPHAPASASAPARHVITAAMVHALHLAHVRHLAHMHAVHLRHDARIKAAGSGSRGQTQKTIGDAARHPITDRLVE